MERNEVPTCQGSAPRVFISYTHEGSAHREWVVSLAGDLLRNGVEVIIDKWDLALGEDVALFMEKGIRSANRVLLVCTPSYARKANEGEGGVGYERMVVTGELAQKIDTNKFVCVLRNGDPESAIPTFGRSRLYVDFRDDSAYQEALERLLRDLHNAPALPKPPLGPNPFGSTDAGQISSARVTPQKEDLHAGPDPLDVYEKAEVLLRQKDMLGWTRLLRNTRHRFVGDVQAWHAQVVKGGQEKEAKDAYRAGALNRLVATASPIGVLALSGVESGIAGANDQLSILDLFLDIPDWPRAGLVWVIRAPELLAFVYHHVFGAFLLESGKHADAIRLLRARVKDGATRQFVELWASLALTGWPESLEGNRVDAWSFLQGLYATQGTWLGKFFISENEYQRGIGAYRFMASVLDFASQMASEGPRETFHLTVPPMFFIQKEWPPELGELLAKAIPSGTVTDAIAAEFHVDRAKLVSLWPLWVDGWFAYFERSHYRTLAGFARTLRAELMPLP